MLSRRHKLAMALAYGTVAGVLLTSASAMVFAKGGVPAPAPAPRPPGGGGGGGGGGVVVPGANFKTIMTMAPGIDPTDPAALALAGPTAAVAKVAGTKFTVALPSLNAALFPAPSKRASVISCQVSATIGPFSTADPTLLLAAVAPEVGNTFSWVGNAPAGTFHTGDKTSVDIVCAGAQTHWSGTL